MEEKKGNLSALFMGAVGGLAVAFATEFFTFPFFHNSIPGMAFVDLANELLLPIYNEIGTALGLAAPTALAAANVPTYSF